MKRDNRILQFRQRISRLLIDPLGKSWTFFTSTFNGNLIFQQWYTSIEFLFSKISIKNPFILCNYGLFTTSSKDISASNWPILKSLEIFNIYVNGGLHFWNNDNLQLIHFFRKFRLEINLYGVKMCYFHNFIKEYLGLKFDDLKKLEHF